MKNIILLNFLLIGILFSCHSSKYMMEKYDEQQVFLNGHPSEEALPGKCYSKSMNRAQEVRWTEVVCEKDLSKGLVNEVQNNLGLLGYEIDPYELRNQEIGESTKNALKNFQIFNEYNYGVFDYATIELLRKRSQ